MLGKSNGGKKKFEVEESGCGTGGKGSRCGLGIIMA